MYMDLFCDKTGTEKRYVQAGSPSWQLPSWLTNVLRKRNCWKAGLTYLIISKIRLHMEKGGAGRYLPAPFFQNLHSYNDQ